MAWSLCQVCGDSTHGVRLGSSAVMPSARFGIDFNVLGITLFRLASCARGSLSKFGIPPLVEFQPFLFV